MRIVLLFALACSGGQHGPRRDDEEACTRRGGTIFTGPATRPYAEQSHVCVMPAGDTGKQCRNGSDCQDLCLCPDPLPTAPPPANPEIPIDTDIDVVGECSTFPAASGAGFYCTVEGGRAHPQGIIVD